MCVTHFTLKPTLCPSRRLAIRDTNYASGEGMSRLAVRGMGEVVIQEMTFRRT